MLVNGMSRMASRRSFGLKGSSSTCRTMHGWGSLILRSGSRRSSAPAAPLSTKAVRATIERRVFIWMFMAGPLMRRLDHVGRASGGTHFLIVRDYVRFDNLGIIARFNANARTIRVDHANPDER